MQAYDFGSEIKKFNESAYGVFNFNDDDRRVFKNADQIQVVFNEDTLIISEIGNIFFKNPGPEEIIRENVIQSRNGEELGLTEHKGERKISFLEKARKKD